MKLTFLSNFLTHHQIPFSNEMFNMPNVEYHFIATNKITDDRIALGYKKCKCEDYPYLVHYSDENNGVTQKLIDESDIVIIGSAPYKLIKNRIKNNKLTFAYSERLFKNIRDYFVILLKGYFLKIYYLPSKKSNMYMLCSSAYTSTDLSKIFAYKKKTYKWGYFTEHIIYNIDELIRKKEKSKLRILWTGRFLKWKHPELAIEVARRLREDGYNFYLDFIGNGEEEFKIKNIMNQYELDDCISFLGSMSPEKVRLHMENSNIFLFTSDFNEGWGAVLNESMNSGCAVVASHAIGSVPFMLKDGQNGLIFKNGDIDNLYLKVKFLFDNTTKIEEFGKAAYKTINEEWNAKIATERLMVLVQKLLTYKNCDEFLTGPCSKANAIDNKWYNRKD